MAQARGDVTVLNQPVDKPDDGGASKARAPNSRGEGFKGCPQAPESCRRTRPRTRFLLLFSRLSASTTQARPPRRSCSSARALDPSTSCRGSRVDRTPKKEYEGCVWVVGHRVLRVGPGTCGPGLCGVAMGPVSRFRVSPCVAQLEVFLQRCRCVVTSSHKPCTRGAKCR